MPSSPEALWERMEAAGIRQPQEGPLSNGLLTDEKLEFDAVTARPSLLQDTGNAVAEMVRPYRPDALVTVPYGSDPLGNVVEDRLKRIHRIYLAKNPDGSFRLQAPEITKHLVTRFSNILVLDDVRTTGGNLQKAMEVKHRGVSVFSGRIGLAAVVIDRAEEPATEIQTGRGGSVPLQSLLHVPIPTWRQEDVAKA